MATSCNCFCVIGVANGRPFSFPDSKNYWKHDAVLPLITGEELPVDFYTFGGGTTPLEQGTYWGTARVVGDGRKCHVCCTICFAAFRMRSQYPSGFFRFCSSLAALMTRMLRNSCLCRTWRSMRTQCLLPPSSA
jgi:hypothetical protein